MEPFSGSCDIPEEELEIAVITVAEKIPGHPKVENVRHDEDVKVTLNPKLLCVVHSF
jgi:hypothetical protein